MTCLDADILAHGILARITGVMVETCRQHKAIQAACVPGCCTASKGGYCVTSVIFLTLLNC